jgi:hypothetical protein
MNTAPLACLLTITLMAGGSAAAQTETRSTQIWRCGPEGRELRDAPCPEATQRPGQRLDYEQPSAAQRSEARQVAERDARLARQLERERLAREAQAPRGAAGIHGRGRPPELAASAPTGKTAKAPKPPKPPQAHKPKLAKPQPPGSKASQASG